MGKTRRTKVRSKGQNPLGVPNGDELAAAIISEGNDAGGPINNIIDQLESANIEEKLCGLQTLSTLCQNNINIGLIIKSDIVRIASPFLVDRNVNLRHATAGALRNLSVNGTEICEILVEQDVLTPLLTLLQEYAADKDWVPVFDKTMNSQLDQKSDVFLQAINIVWNLCESTSVALGFLNQSLLLESFIRYLNYTVYGNDIAIAVAQCLLVVTEDNPTSWKVLTNYGNEFVHLLNLDNDPNNQFANTFLRTLAAGIVTNVPALSATFLNQILQSVSKTLNLNHRIVLGKLSSSLPIDGVDQEGYEIEVTDDHMIEMEQETEEQAVKRRRKADMPSDLDLEVTNVEYLLEAQRIGAETLTNLCSFNDEEATIGNDEEEMSDAESVNDYDVSNYSSTTNLDNTDKIPVEIQEAVKALGLIEKLWERAHPIPDNVNDILQETRSVVLKKLRRMRISSVLCLQNLCNSFTTEDLGGPEALYAVWLELGQQAFQGPQDTEILEAITTLMRSALEHLKTSPQLFIKMTSEDLELMLNGVKSCTESEIRANWLRMLGILGCVLPEPLVKIIIHFVLEVCSTKEIDAWSMSESLDALMDMFSDKDWLQISYEVNLAKRAKEFEKILKTKSRQEKRELAERYHAIQTVKVNLGRFSKYIEGQLKSYKPQQ